MKQAIVDDLAYTTDLPTMLSEQRPLIWIVEDIPGDCSRVERSLGTSFDFERFGSVALVLDRLARGTPPPDVLLVDVVAAPLAEQVAHGMAEVTIIVMTDVTNEVLRTRVDSAIRIRRAEQAVIAERERIALFQQEMAAIVGHDLRAPLGAILIGTEMLTEGMKNDPASAYVVTRIESSARRMTRMVAQLLDMTSARLGTGIPLVRRSMRLLPLLDSVMRELVRAHAGTRFELVAEADVTGLWDQDRIGQVAANLLSNAIFYGLKGTPIVVGVTDRDHVATITVHNQLRDKPIPPDALAALFLPHRRADHPHNARGLGLGLYIVHEIIVAHGGSIEVESVPSGTTFRVRLPENLS